MLRTKQTTSTQQFHEKNKCCHVIIKKSSHDNNRKTYSLSFFLPVCLCPVPEFVPFMFLTFVFCAQSSQTLKTFPWNQTTWPSTHLSIFVVMLASPPRQRRQRERERRLVNLACWRGSVTLWFCPLIHWWTQLYWCLLNQLFFSRANRELTI